MGPKTKVPCTNERCSIGPRNSASFRQVVALVLDLILFLKFQCCKSSGTLTISQSELLKMSHILLILCQLSYLITGCWYEWLWDKVQAWKDRLIVQKLDIPPRQLQIPLTTVCWCSTNVLDSEKAQYPSLKPPIFEPWKELVTRIRAKFHKE